MPLPPENPNQFEKQAHGMPNAPKKLAAIRTGIDTRNALADLGGKLLPPEMQIPLDATVTSVIATTNGHVSDSVVRMDTVKAKLDFKTPDGGEDYRRPKSKIREVSIADVPELYMLRMQKNSRVFMDVFADTNSANRFQGKIQIDLPFIISDAGDIEEYKSSVKKRKDIGLLFENLGGFENYPHAAIIGALTKEYRDSDVKFEIETEGEYDDKEGIFGGRQNIVIRFSHDVAHVSDAIKKYGNARRPREQRVEKTKTEADVPAPEPKKAPEKEIEKKDTALKLQINGISLTRDIATRKLLFKAKEIPEFMKGCKYDAIMEQSREMPNAANVTLLVYKDGKTLRFEAAQLIPTNRPNSIFDVEFILGNP